MDALLKQIAGRNGAKFIDLHSRLTDSDGLMKPALTNDGLHFKNEGYRILGRLMEKTVAEAEASSAGSGSSAGTHARPASTNSRSRSAGSSSCPRTEKGAASVLGDLFGRI